MILRRNKTSNIYEEEIAGKVVQNILTEYVSFFKYFQQ